MKQEPVLKWSDKVKDLPLEEKVSRSKKVLQDVVDKMDKDLPLIVNFSGGKDSVTCLLLARMVTDNVVAFYVDGGMELPGTLEYVKEQAKKYGAELRVAKVGVDKVNHIAGGSLDGCHTFEDYVRHYGYFPTSGCRWCSIWLKQRIMKAYWRRFYGVDRVLYKLNGVRMFESRVRLWKYGDEKHFKKYSVDGTPYLRYDNEHRPCITVLPIVEWTSEDVVEFLKINGVEIHGGYKKYGFSGCKWCPVHKREDYIKALRIDMSLYDDIIQLEKDINRPACSNGEFLGDIKKELENEGL